MPILLVFHTQCIRRSSLLQPPNELHSAANAGAVKAAEPRVAPLIANDVATLKITCEPFRIFIAPCAKYDLNKSSLARAFAYCQSGEVSKKLVKSRLWGMIQNRVKLQQHALLGL